jgi:putative oxidoreductase
MLADKYPAMPDTASATRSVIPGLGRLYAKLAPYSYAFMRFSTGAILAPHGIQKLFFGGVVGNAAAVAKMGLYPPTAWSYLVAFTECFCAIALALGLFTRVAALFIIGEMAVIALVVQIKFGYFWTQRGNEFPLLLLLLAIAIFFRGGGRYSLDHVIGKEL